MSLVHRLIVGHFDIDTFVPHRPVPLRPLDDRRTRAMLGEIGERVGEDEYDVGGEPLYFVDGYCDCPWLSYRHNETSERFARALAAAEDCFLIEQGVGTILHLSGLSRRSRAGTGRRKTASRPLCHGPRRRPSFRAATP